MASGLSQRRARALRWVRVSAYRKPSASSRRRRAGVLVKAAEPPELDPAELQRETGKLLARQMADDARDLAREERRLKTAAWVVDLLRSLFS